MSSGNWVLTCDGWGEIVSTSRSLFGAVQYQVIGDFGSGHYSAHQIESEIDEDRITNDLNFKKDKGAGDNTNTVVPEENKWLDGGTRLPWDPEPTEVWHGELNQEFDDHNISLTPTNSLKGHDVHPDPENHNAIFENRKSRNFLAFDPEDSDWAETQDYADMERGTGAHEQNDYELKSKPRNYQPQFGTPENPAPVHVRRSNKHSDPDDISGYREEDDDKDDYEDDSLVKHQGPGKHEASVGPRQAFVDYINLLESNKLVKEAAWKDVRRKAKKIWDSGKVLVKANDGREIFATVKGDHGTYDVQVHRKNAFGQGITWYDCNCEWGKWAYKRERTFIGRLCSHGLATYYAMQAKAAPTKTVTKSKGPVRQKLTAKAPESTPVETRSRAAIQGGLMVWDDDLQKVMKQIFNQPGAALSADPSGAGAAPAADPAAAAPALDPSLDPAGAAPALPGTDPSQYVRTAEFQKDPDPANNFEEWPEPNSEDAHTFNTTDNFKNDKNDSEFAMYDHFWGKSSAFDANDNPIDPHTLQPKDPALKAQKLQPHFVRKSPVTAASIDHAETEGHTPAELAATIKQFKLNGDSDAAHKFIEERRKLEKAHQGAKDEVDYSKSVEEDHKSHWEENPNEGVNGGTYDYNGGADQADDYQSEFQGRKWLDENEAEWESGNFGPHDDDDEDSHKKSSAYRNEQEAVEFNDGSSELVKSFQRNAGWLMSQNNSDSDDFHAEFQRRTAGRHFNYAEQQELIDEPGTARHLADLNLEDSFYLD